MSFEAPSDMGNDTVAEPTCARIPAAPIQSSMRPHCRQKSDCAALSDRHCKQCAAKVRATPEYRAMMSAAKVRALSDPEKRKRVADRAAENLRAWHAAVDWSEFNSHRLSHIPEERRDEYRRLQRRMGAGEARRIIEEDIRHHSAGRREVSRISAELRAKHEREKAQRY